MKTKFLFGLLIIILTCGCEEEKISYENPVYSGNAKLKRISCYSSGNSEIPIGIVAEYEYDDEGKISKVSIPMYDSGDIIGLSQYDVYIYNSQDQLIKIENFNANINSPTGFINLKNTAYTYFDNGKIEKIHVEYPIINTFEYFLYRYDNDNLSRIEKYGKSDNLESYIANEYDNFGNLVKEISYGDDNQPYSYTQHLFENGLNIQSDIFSGENNKEHVREIFRSYDKNGNLIILESNELVTYSSAMSYIWKYEYYDE